jgi:hypothetical protein
MLEAERRVVDQMLRIHRSHRAADHRRSERRSMAVGFEVHVDFGSWSQGSKCGDARARWA